ncbi:MAG: carbohydrate ABC transporter substrate-binding protein, partial [Pseudomonadota bacterium]
RRTSHRRYSATTAAPNEGSLEHWCRLATNGRGLASDRTRSDPQVLDYPRLAQLWWQNIGDAMSGAKTAQEALDALCADQEAVLERLERAGVQGDLGPVMNDEQDPETWLSQPGAPKAKLDNEKPTPVTVSYDELIKSWQQ